MIDFLKKFKFELSLVGVILALTLAFVLLGEQLQVFSDREAFIEKVKSLGVWGPVIIVFVSFIDVLIAPFPGGISPSVAGFVFGKLNGTLLVLVGNILGANATFWIARIWGKRFFLLFLKEERIDRFREMVKNNQKYFWAAFFIPILPYDILNIAIGLSEIKWKKFILLNSLGMAVSMTILTFFGSSIAELLF